jgi:hypothetical protein
VIGAQGRGSPLRAFLICLLVMIGGCPTGPQAPPPPSGGLRFEGSPPEALVTIDEQLAGTLRQIGELPVLLRPGTHRVQVTAPGYFPWYAEIEVGETVQTIPVTIRPVPE